MRSVPRTSEVQGLGESLGQFALARFRERAPSRGDTFVNIAASLTWWLLLQNNSRLWDFQLQLPFHVEASLVCELGWIGDKRFFCLSMQIVNDRIYENVYIALLTILWAIPNPSFLTLGLTRSELLSRLTSGLANDAHLSHDIIVLDKSLAVYIYLNGDNFKCRRHLIGNS